MNFENEIKMILDGNEIEEFASETPKQIANQAKKIQGALKKQSSMLSKMYQKAMKTYQTLKKTDKEKAAPFYHIAVNIGKVGDGVKNALQTQLSINNS